MNTFRSTLAAATLALAGLVASQPAFAYERWVDIVNDGNVAIWSVRMTHVDDDSFGRDLLGDNVIPAGYEARVEPDVNNGYCRFDIEITYEDGRELILWRVNLCEATAIVTDGYASHVEYI